MAVCWEGLVGRHVTKDNCRYDEIEFRQTSSEIRNPDGSLVFEAKDIMLELEPGRMRCPGPEILPQSGRSRKAEESQRHVPEWLWRGVPDEGQGGSAKDEQTSASPAQSRFSIVWRAPGPIGAGKAAISIWRRMATYFDEMVYARPSDGRAELAAMVQHRTALGLWH